MKISGYIIPKSLQQNEFIKSLYKQEQHNKLSTSQTNALKDMLEIEEEFYMFPEACPFKSETIFDSCESDYYNLLDKLKRNRMKSIKSKNKVIRALNAYMEKDPKSWLNDKGLGRDYDYRRSYFR